MRAPLAQQQQPAPTMLHAVWWQVLKPGTLLLPNGQPVFDVVHTTETLAEATAHVRNIPGGMIVANVVVFVNPAAAAAGPKPQ